MILSLLTFAVGTVALAGIAIIVAGMLLPAILAVALLFLP